MYEPVSIVAASFPSDRRTTWITSSHPPKAAVPPSRAEAASAGEGPPTGPAASLRLEELERQAILEALRRTQRNQVKAARLLGITDRTLREKLRRYRQDGLPDGVPIGVPPVGDSAWARG